MQFVDAQIHIWGSGLPSNQMHRQVASFSAAEAIAMMDEGGVDAAVLNPPPWDDPGGTELAYQAVEAYPGRFAIMGWLKPETPPSPELVANLCDRPGMLGLRLLCGLEPARSLLDDGVLDWVWPAAEEAGIPVAILAPHSLPVVGRIAERHPGLKLAIDHLGGRGGNTTLKDDAAMVHMPELLALAKHPNVAVKATGAPGYSAEPYPFPIMQGHVRQIFDAFGPERTFWGTDITKMPCSWRQCITMFTEEMPWLSGRDLELVMGDAVCAWWGWDRGSR